MGAATQPTPQRLIVGNCHGQCTFYPGKLNELHEAVHAIFEAGGTNDSIAERLRAIGIQTNKTSVWRHRRHLVKAAPQDDAPPEGAEVKDIDIVEAALRKAWANRRNWKPSLADTIKLIQLKHDLTGGRDYDPMLETMAAAISDGDLPDPINPDMSDQMAIEADNLTPEEEGYR